MALSFRSLHSARGCSVPERKKCVGEMGKMGVLELEILCSSGSDSLVTRTWGTLSPSQLLTNYSD